MIEVDRVVRVAPLGLLAWDVATAVPAGTGLTIVARPSGHPDRPATVGVRNASGVYVLRGLSGLGASERGDGDGDYWAHPPRTRTYRVEVSDPQRRYLPVSFEVTAPTRGLAGPPCPTPGITARVVPLFPAPARPLPAGLAVVRAQLELAGEPATGVPGAARPASWALLEVLLPDGRSARGLADGAGRATVLFGWPEPLPVTGTPEPEPDPDSDTENGNGNGNGARSLWQQTWTLGLRAFFGVGAIGLPPAPVAAPDGVPDLCAVLSQHPALLLADAAGAAPITEARLRYGRELVIRTAGRSTVLLTSPPRQPIQPSPE